MVTVMKGLVKAKNLHNKTTVVESIKPCCWLGLEMVKSYFLGFQKRPYSRCSPGHLFFKQLIHREKLEASTPLKSVQSPFSLTGSTMSPISKRQAATRNVDSLACTPALKKRVAFDVVDTPTSFSHDTPLQRKATPFSSRLGASTPSGVMMRPHDSTPVKSKRARTSSVSNLENIPSSNKHLRSCTVHTPSHKRRPCETPFTPSGLISGFMADVSFDDSFTCSSPARHGTPPRIKRRLSEIDYSVRRLFFLTICFFLCLVFLSFVKLTYLLSGLFID